jgi:hypothetical protein
MGVQLGLRDLVVHYGQNYNQTSVLPPRMLPLPDTFVNQEERIRAYWMIECLDVSISLGVAWNLSLVPLLSEDLMPCDEDLWGYGRQEGLRPDPITKSSSFSVYVSLITNALVPVRSSFQEPYDLSQIMEQERWLADCDKVYDRISQWHATAPDGLQVAYGFSAEGSLQFDVNILAVDIAFHR